MALQIFVRPEKPKPTRAPKVTVAPGRSSIALSREALVLLGVTSKTGCSVLLVVDRDTNAWGMVPTENDDKRGFKVTIAPNGNGRVLQSKIFIDTIKLAAGPYVVTPTKAPISDHAIVAPFRSHVA